MKSNSKRAIQRVKREIKRSADLRRRVKGKCTNAYRIMAQIDKLESDMVSSYRDETFSCIPESLRIQHVRELDKLIQADSAFTRDVI